MLECSKNCSKSRKERTLPNFKSRSDHWIDVFDSKMDLSMYLLPKHAFCLIFESCLQAQSGQKLKCRRNSKKNLLRPHMSVKSRWLFLLLPSVATGVNRHVLHQGLMDSQHIEIICTTTQYVSPIHSRCHPWSSQLFFLISSPSSELHRPNTIATARCSLPSSLPLRRSRL